MDRPQREVHDLFETGRCLASRPFDLQPLDVLGVTFDPRRVMPQRTSRTAQSDPDPLPAGTGEVAYGHPTQLNTFQARRDGGPNPSQTGIRHGGAAGRVVHVTSSTNASNVPLGKELRRTACEMGSYAGPAASCDTPMDKTLMGGLPIEPVKISLRFSTPWIMANRQRTRPHIAIIRPAAREARHRLGARDR